MPSSVDAAACNAVTSLQGDVQHCQSSQSTVHERLEALAVQGRAQGGSSDLFGSPLWPMDPEFENSDRVVVLI